MSKEEYYRTNGMSYMNKEQETMTDNQSKHTAAPWAVGECDPDQMINVYGGDGLSIAVEVQGADLTEAEANARLIAAAPELLKVLESTFEALKNGSYDENNVEPILKVIAKAKG